MTRPGLGLSSRPTEPQRVKFKEFLFTPNASEPILLINVDRDIQTSQHPKQEFPLNEKQFFKVCTMDSLMHDELTSLRLNLITTTISVQYQMLKSSLNTTK